MRGQTQISTGEIPCALKSLVHDGVDRKTLTSLDHDACQKLFLEWVQEDRNHASEVEKDELNRCPLMWCRRSFETTDLAINHVFTCPHLCKAWYWCPHHGRPELFSACKRECELKVKPEMSQAAKFFNCRGRTRSLERLVESEQDEFMSLCSIEKSSPPSRKPGVNDMDGREMPHTTYCQELYAYSAPPSKMPMSASFGAHGTYDRSAPLPDLPPSDSSRQRASPELFHPVNNEADRDSLWQRMRGGAAVRRHPSTNSQYRGDWPLVDAPEDTISALSCRPSEPYDSFFVQPSDGEAKFTNASDSTISTDEPEGLHKPGMSVFPMSHTAPPGISAPTVDCLVSNVISPITQTSDRPSAPSNLWSPVIPIADKENPSSAVVYPATVTATMSHDDPGPRIGKYHHGLVDTWDSLRTSPLPSPRREVKDTSSAWNALDPHSRIPGPIPHSAEVLDYGAQQTNDTKAQQPLHPNRWQCELEDTNPLSLSIQLQPCHVYECTSGVSTNLNNIDSILEPVALRSTSQISMTPIDALVPDKSNPLPFESTFKHPIQNPLVESSPQAINDYLAPFEATHLALISTASSSFSPLDPPISGVPASMVQPLGMDDDAMEWNSCGTSSGFDSSNGESRRTKPSDNFEMEDGVMRKYEEARMTKHSQKGNIHQSERFNAGHSLTFPDIRLGSPPENLIATLTSEPIALDHSGFFKDVHLSSSAQEHGRSFADRHVILQPHCFDYGPLRLTTSPPNPFQVIELQEYIHIINPEWLKRMQSVPELFSRCCTVQTSTLFDRAVRSLKYLLCDAYPTTFEDVFAIMHLGFAAAFSLHWQHGFFYWDHLCRDALQWQQAISTMEDKVLFQNAMRYWSSADFEPLPLPTGNCYDSSSSIMPLEMFQFREQKISWETLAKSEIFKSCIGFLGGKSPEPRFEACSDRSDNGLELENARICEETDHFRAQRLEVNAQSRTTEVQQMKTIITHLQQERGVEALQGILIDTETLIDDGVLCNLREVEVILISSARWSSESHEVFERFHELVTFYLDEVMQSSDWRNVLYAAGLERLLELPEELNRLPYTEPAVPCWPDTGSFQEPRLRDSLGSSSSTSNKADTFDISPTSGLSSAATDSSYTVEPSSQNTSPTTMSQASISPTATDSKTSKAVTCLSCSKLFKGNYADASSNYRRHLRESKRHNKDYGLKCPQPECVAKSPMRSDNLKKHLIDLHKMSSSEAQTIKESCRASTKKGDKGKISRGKTR